MVAETMTMDDLLVKVMTVLPLVLTTPERDPEEVIRRGSLEAQEVQGGEGDHPGGAEEDLRRVG